MVLCSRLTVLSANVLLIIVACGGIGFGIYSIVSDSTEGPTSFPENWYITIIGILIGFLLVSTIGIAGVQTRKRIPTCVHFFFMFILFIVVVAGFTTLLLFANEEAGEAEGTIGDLVQQVESYYSRWAPENPDEWIQLQDNIECCGISAEKAFELKNIFDVIHSGALCSEGGVATALNVTVNSLTGFDDDAREQIEETVDNPLFFCRDRVIDNFRKWTPGFAGAVGAIVLVQACILFSIFNMFCCVSEEKGGFAVLDDDNGAYKGFSSGPGSGNTGDGVPEPNSGKDTSFYNAPSKPSTFLDTAKTLGNRASMRMGFGPTFGGGGGSTAPPPGNMPPPGMGSSIVPAGGSFSNNGGGGGLPQPNSGLPQPNSGLPQPNSGLGGGGGGGSPGGFAAVKNFGNRMSMNLKQMMGRRGPPPGPPPSFGGGAPSGGDSGFGGGSSGFGGAPPGFGGPGGGSGGGGGGGGGLPQPNSGLPQPNSGFGGSSGGGGGAKGKKGKPPKLGGGLPPPPGKGGGFLADIKKGKVAKKLNHTETIDKSAPRFDI